jgi:hypothetical protein
MRAQNHPLLKARRDRFTGILVLPPEPADPRLEKVQALADRPGTEGERAAAQAALDRIQSREVAA